MYRNRFDGVSKCLEVSNLEDFENLNSNLLFVFEKITSDKDLAENFSKFKTGDELYNFCLKIKDGYSREEWEEFIEILYILICDEKNVKITLSDDLNQVSGGNTLDNIKKKFLAGTLAALSLMSATGTINPKVLAAESGVSSTSYSRSKNMKRLKRIALGLGTAIVTAAIGAYLYKKFEPTIKVKLRSYGLGNGNDNNKNSQDEGKSGSTQQVTPGNESSQSAAGTPVAESGTSETQSTKKLKKDLSSSKGSSKSGGTQQVTPGNESSQSAAGTPVAESGTSETQSTKKLKKDLSSSKGSSKSGGTQQVTPGNESSQSAAGTPVAESGTSETQAADKTDSAKPDSQHKEQVSKVPLSLLYKNGRPNGLFNLGNSCYLNALMQLLVRGDLFNGLSKAKANGAKLSPQANACLTIKEAITGTRKVSRSELDNAARTLGYRSSQEDVGEVAPLIIGPVFEEAGVSYRVISNPVQLIDSDGQGVTMDDILKRGGDGDRAKKIAAVRKLKPEYENLSDEDAANRFSELPLSKDWECGSELQVTPVNGYFVVNANRTAKDGGKNNIRVNTDLPGYEFCAAIVHRGKSIEGGHYAVFVKDENGDGWNLCNDMDVRRVSFEQVKNGVCYRFQRPIPGVERDGVMYLYRELEEKA